jgi:Xaa-Pro aminopeptidase
MNIMNRTSEVVNRIDSLKLQMKSEGIDAYIITGADPHLCEYPPEYWKTREWITGFTGSYGKVLLTQEKVMLWTDTRYFLQVGEELKGTGIILMKERVPDAISMTEWIADHLESGEVVAVDGLTISAGEAIEIKEKLKAKGIIFQCDIDLVTPNWTKRPNLSVKPVYEHSIAFAGNSRSEKIESVRKTLNQSGHDAMVVSMLDDLAWLLNLRGDDIQYIPLFNAYGYIDQDCTWLFIEQGKISEISEILEHDGIRVEAYEKFFDFLRRLTGQKIQIDPIRTNFHIVTLLSESNSIGYFPSAITQIKSVKSQHEINCIKSAHTRDGAALVNFLFWLTNSIDKEYVTELSIGKKLEEFRSRQEYFKGVSFYPIVGYGPHGAIVHYHANDVTDVSVTSGNLLLIDSGGQYLDGTTDITRTIALGTPSKKQQEDFTICLKGHISLAKAVFPVGTRGYSLDPFARKPLWDNGMNYGHGTGHGIGYFLSVHEGPMSIRAEFNNEPIMERQILTNEPGIYREGEYGIRIENVILCKKHETVGFDNFLCFETISLCPIDHKLIEKDLLTNEEIDWFNKYHQKVYNCLAPLISDPAVVSWLKLQCVPLD